MSATGSTSSRTGTQGIKRLLRSRAILVTSCDPLTTYDAESGRVLAASLSDPGVPRVFLWALDTFSTTVAVTVFVSL
jgi:hypothetical protein